MNAEDLILEIEREFEGVMRAEIATAFDLDPQSVGNIIMKRGGKRRARAHQRPQDRDLIREIQDYANRKMGGKVEIINIRGEQLALCVGGRLVA